MMKRYIYIFKG